MQPLDTVIRCACKLLIVLSLGQVCPCSGVVVSIVFDPEGSQGLVVECSRSYGTLCKRTFEWAALSQVLAH